MFSQREERERSTTTKLRTKKEGSISDFTMDEWTVDDPRSRGDGWKKRSATIVCCRRVALVVQQFDE